MVSPHTTPNHEDIADILDLLSHDLKSPTGILLSSLEVLKETFELAVNSDDTPETALVKTCMGAAERQLFLIETLLGYFQFRYNPQPVPVGDIYLKDILPDLKQRIDSLTIGKKITPTYDIADDLPAFLADSDLLRQVVPAVIDSSLKFCMSGTPLIIRARADEQHVHLSFLDKGRPILPEFQDSFFDLAHQTKAREAGSRTSVGMNLPFAREAMNAMKGKISAASTDEGTCITLSFRRALEFDSDFIIT